MPRRRQRLLFLALPVVALASLLTAEVTPVQATPVASAAGPVSAAVPLGDRDAIRKKAVDAALNDLREQLEGTSKQLTDAVLALRRFQDELKVRQNELQKAQTQVKEANDRYTDLTAQLRGARSQESKAAAEVQKGLDDIARTRAALGRIARDTYVTNGSVSQLSMTLDATSPEEFAASMSAAATALKVEERAKDRLGSQHVTNRRQAEYLSALRQQVAAYLDEAEEVLRVRQAAEDKAEVARRQIAEIVRNQQAAVHVIHMQKAAEQQRLAKLDAEQKHLKQILAARAAAAKAKARKHHRPVYVPSKSRYLSRPADGPITSPFGWRRHPIFHIRRLHTGTDFGVPCGTTVHAAADGVVVLSGWSGGYGYRVVIDHGLVRGVGLATTYNHNSRLLVHSGQQVSRGQAISISGTTGSSTGCHLHFEVLADGVYVNPMRWL